MEYLIESLSAEQRMVLLYAFRSNGSVKSGRYGFRKSTLSVLERHGLVSMTWKGAFDAGWNITVYGEDVAKQLSEVKSA